jgi:hypothetical protein
MKIIRLLLSNNEKHNFELYGVAPPALLTSDEKQRTNIWQARRKKRNRLSQKFQAIREVAQRHWMAKRERPIPAEALVPSETLPAEPRRRNAKGQLRNASDCTVLLRRLRWLALLLRNPGFSCS